MNVNYKKGTKIMTNEKKQEKRLLVFETILHDFLQKRETAYLYSKNHEKLKKTIKWCKTKARPSVFFSILNEKKVYFFFSLFFWNMLIGESQNFQKLIKKKRPFSCSTFFFWFIYQTIIYHFEWKLHCDKNEKKRQKRDFSLI